MALPGSALDFLCDLEQVIALPSAWASSPGRQRCCFGKPQVPRLWGRMPSPNQPRLSGDKTKIGAEEIPLEFPRAARGHRGPEVQVGLQKWPVSG